MERRRFTPNGGRRRIARQKEIDASIAARAEYEYLYDKPYEDKNKVRVAGPFTVESISPHRVLGVDEHGDIICGVVQRLRHRVRLRRRDSRQLENFGRSASPQGR